MKGHKPFGLPVDKSWDNSAVGKSPRYPQAIPIKRTACHDDVYKLLHKAKPLPIQGSIELSTENPVTNSYIYNKKTNTIRDKIFLIFLLFVPKSLNRPVYKKAPVTVGTPVTVLFMRYFLTDAN